MSNEEYNDMDIKQAEWRGYALRALEDMNKEIKEMKEQSRRIEKKIDKVNAKLTNTQIKIAGLSGTISIIVTIVTALIINSLVV